MTVKELSQNESFKAVAMPDDERVIGGVYIGDLLSWVMGRAAADEAWITIMSNINIVAVAALTDTACIILAEGVTLNQDVIDTAVNKSINILSSDKSAYEISVFLHSAI